MLLTNNIRFSMMTVELMYAFLLVEAKVHVCRYGNQSSSFLLSESVSQSVQLVSPVLALCIFCCDFLALCVTILQVA
jgi:hypothetical protein